MKISEELSARLKTFITINNTKPDEQLFKGNERRFGEHYRRLRNRLAKTSRPTIKTIRLYDLRHAYVTKQLRRCQNVETVRQIIGHKQLNTTQKYMHLAGTNGEWILEGTTDKNRAMQLIAQDFICVNTAPDGTMIYKKAK